MNVSGKIAELDQEKFRVFLQWLHPDVKRAGHIYEDIRFKLHKFFEWRGCWECEECADITIDRVLHKVTAGEEIRTSNHYLYFLGVARNVLFEYWKKPKSTPVEDVTESKQLYTDPGQHEENLFAEEQWSKQVACMKRCMSTLPEDKRVLITGYYQGKRREKINNRQKLAEWLNLSENALRLRMFRIRDELEKCVKKCLKT